MDHLSESSDLRYASGDDAIRRSIWLIFAGDNRVANCIEITSMPRWCSDTAGKAFYKGKAFINGLPFQFRTRDDDLWHGLCLLMQAVPNLLVFVSNLGMDAKVPRQMIHLNQFYNVGVVLSPINAPAHER